MIKIENLSRELKKLYVDFRNDNNTMHSINEL